jgi:hypothetical protein
MHFLTTQVIDIKLIWSMRLEVLKGMHIVIAVFRDATTCSLVLEKPATSIFRAKAVRENKAHDKGGRTGNQEST